jgi:hypothetical protein
METSDMCIINITITETRCLIAGSIPGGFGLDVVTIYDVVFKLEYSFNQLNQHAMFIHLNEF